MKASIRKSVALVLAGVLAWPPGAIAQAARPAKKVDEAVQLERRIKKRYQELIRVMHEVAQNLAKADPETAAAVEGAAQKAEEALIADDMDRVVQLLQAGLVLPADATQAKIIERLREVLKALQGGDELEWRLFMLERMQEEQEALQEIIRVQRELERISRMLAFGDRVKADLAAARDQADQLRTAQEALMKRTRGLQPDPVASRLGSIRQILQDVQGRFDMAKEKSFKKRYPSPDEMAACVVHARAIMKDAIQGRTAIRTVLNDTTVNEALEKAGAGGKKTGLDETVSRIIDELNKAGQAYENQDLDEALVAIAEAEVSLLDAIGTLQELMGEIPSTKPFVAILDEHRELAALAETLAPRIETLTPVQPGHQVRFKAPDAPFGMERREQTNSVAAMSSALFRYDLDGALFLQEQNLGRLALWSSRLETAAGEVDERKRDPRFPRQKERQARVTAAVLEIVTRNRERAADLAAPPADGAPAQKPIALPGALITDLAKAADWGTSAGGHLGAEQATPANHDQNEAIRLLEHVVADMASMVAAMYEVLLEEINEQWIAIIHRMILKQKVCSAETLVVWKKRLPNKTFRRAEQLQMVTLSNAEGRMLKDLEAIDKSLEIYSHGHAWAPPPPIFYLLKDMITDALADTRDRLKGHDPGPETQELQKDLLTWLEAILKAMMGTEGENDPGKSPQWGWNGFGNPDAAKKDRLAEIGMMISLQKHVNRKVKRLASEAGKVAGTEASKEFEKAATLQAQIRTMIEEFVVLDDKLWMER